MWQGATPVTAHRSVMLDVQQASCPPGRLEQPTPPHSPHSDGQQYCSSGDRCPSHTNPPTGVGAGTVGSGTAVGSLGSAVGAGTSGVPGSGTSGVTGTGTTGAGVPASTGISSGGDVAVLTGARS